MARDNYCDICHVKTGDVVSFASHIVGRKHQIQLKRINKAGYDKWAKKEAKKLRRKSKRVVETKQSEKLVKKRSKGVSRPSRVLKELTPEEKLSSSKAGKSGGDRKLLQDCVKSAAHERELRSSNYSKEVGNCSSLEKTAAVLPKDVNQTEVNSSVSPPSSHSSKMHPRENFSVPPYHARTAFPQFNPLQPPPNFHYSGMNARQQWRHYRPPPPPPLLDYRGKFQHYRGYSPRTFPPLAFTGAHPFRPKYPYEQGMNFNDVPPQNSKDSRHGEMQNELSDKLHTSSSGSQERPVAEKHKDMGSRSYGSRLQSDFHHKSNVSQSKYGESSKSAEVRTSKDVRSEKPRMGHTVQNARVSQSKSETSGKLHTVANECLSRKSPSHLNSVDCTKARSLPSKSCDAAAAKSPTFSNVVMQRMNARLHSFTKYGKMPTSGQIRHLALSSTSSVQEKADGKLQEWSKKINESHHNLSAQDKELINRLVNYPCSRREQKKLEYCIREHARSRRKLTLPRFNLQLSGMETCKDTSSVDDNVNSMATEVVNCLPEDVLNSLINVLNSDVDENIIVDFPFGMDTSLPAPPEGEHGVPDSSDVEYSTKLLNEDVFITLDEVEDNSSCEETAECPEQQYPDSVHSASSHPEHSSPYRDDQVCEHNSAVTDHNGAVEATEQLALGSSIEICESQKIADKKILTAGQQESVSVEIKIKKEPLDPQEENTEASIGCTGSNDSAENSLLAVLLSSENPTKTCANSGSVCLPVKNETYDTLSVGATEASSYPSTISSSLHKSSAAEIRNLAVEIKSEPIEQPSDSVVVPEVTMETNRENHRTIALGVGLLPSVTEHNNKHILNHGTKEKSAVTVNHQNEELENVSNYSGLFWITKPGYKPAEKMAESNKSFIEATDVTNLPHSVGTLLTPPALHQTSHIQDASSFCNATDQRVENHANSTSGVAEATVTKIEPHSDKSEETAHMLANEQTTLPKICGVTSILNSENIGGALLDVYPTIHIKQEYQSPAPEVTNGFNQNCVAREENKMNCFEAKLAGTPQANSLDLGVSSHAIAASFPGVIHKVQPCIQGEDPEKTPEVSSSTGTIVLDEAQVAPLIEPGHTYHPEPSSKDGPSLDLIRELLAITASEEKLVQQAREAERTIALLTASLEEWKHKKYQIEQEQMKLRMKRQELLLTAAKGSVPCDKQSSASFQSASMQSETTLGFEKSGSESESHCSQSVNRAHHTKFNIKKRRGRKRRHCSSGELAETMKQKLRPRRKREVSDESLSDSSASFLSTRTSKLQIRTRSSQRDGHRCSSPDSNKKKRYNMMDAQVVLQPLKLENSTDRNFLVNDDEIIILKESPCHSTKLKEEVELDSSEEAGTEQDEEGFGSSQENVITPSTESAPDLEFVVNIGALNAHSMTVVDLKVYDDYLYSCSVDCSAKRFSLKDPQDSTSYEGHTKTVTSICLSPLKEVYTTCNDRYLRCFTPDTGVIINSFEMRTGISCSCEGGGTLYLGLNSGEVIFFNFKLKKEVYKLSCSASCAIGQLATVTQGALRLLCVAANDGIVSLYDTATGLLLRYLEGRVHPPCWIKICDNSIYTTSEKSVVIHDLLSGKLERMMNWPSSATGLEIIDNFILTSSYDGLIRCYDKNQDMMFHSSYYGSAKGMIMYMTAYKDWVFTGNRHGLIEAFKFDSSKRFSCEYGRCHLNFGRECDVLHHVTNDHLPFVNMKAKSCPWRTCTYTFTPRTTLEEKKLHIKEHITSVH